MKLKNPLLKNHWANFNQSWPKHPWMIGIHVSSNEVPRPFPRGDNYEVSKNTLLKLNNLLLQNHWPSFNQTWHKAFLGEGDSILFKSRPHPLSRRDNYEIAKKIDDIKKNFLSRTTRPISTKLGTMHPSVKGIQVCSNKWAPPFSMGR